LLIDQRGFDHHSCVRHFVMSVHQSEDGAPAVALTGSSMPLDEMAMVGYLLPDSPSDAYTTTSTINSLTGDVHGHVERAPFESPQGEGVGTPPAHFVPSPAAPAAAAPQDAQHHSR
jgi:hypothetical protein